MVSDGRYVRGRAEVVGEEPMLLAGLAPGVPVLVGRRRDTVGRRAVAAFDAQVLVLDDGFQHHRLAKDVEIVAFYGRGPRQRARCCRAARCASRSRALSSRARASWSWTGRSRRATRRAIARAAPGAARFELSRRPAATRPLAGGAARARGEARGPARRPALGHRAPRGAARARCAALGAHVVAERAFPDHHRYRREDLAGLAADAGSGSPPRRTPGSSCPRGRDGAEVRVLELATDFPAGEAFLDWLEERLR